MTSLAPTPQLPEPFAFAHEAASLRPATSSLAHREEMSLHLLARELAHYAPALTQRLRDRGMARMREELVGAA